MEWFEPIKELIPGIKKYKKFCASLFLSFFVLAYFINNPEKTSFLFAIPLLLLAITLVAICLSFFLLDKIEYMKEACPELKNPQEITMKEIDHVINLLAADIDIKVYKQEPGIDPSNSFILNYTLNKYFMLIAALCYRTSASRTEIENRLYNARNRCAPIIIAIGGYTKTIDDLITKLASLDLIRNTTISDYQQETRWTLTPLGERVYKEIEMREFDLKRKK